MPALADLEGWFAPAGSAMVALSGGVDSALVALAARRALGAGALAVTADYSAMPRDELADARRVCREMGMRHEVVRYDELADEAYARNAPDRCFHCRSGLSRRLAGLAARRGIGLVADGTHLGDLGDYRPGIAAMHAGGVRSPLAEAGFAKADVRREARLAGLSVHDKPANACLASRIPWGTRVTAERLARVEAAESLVRAETGARQVRVRDAAGGARIEVEPELVGRLEAAAGRLGPRLLALGFESVEVDPAGYAPGKANAAGR